MKLAPQCITSRNYARNLLQVLQYLKQKILYVIFPPSCNMVIFTKIKAWNQFSAVDISRLLYCFEII